MRTMRFASSALRRVLAAALACGWITGQAAAQAPLALSQVPVPEPRNLSRFVADRDAAVRLGKALFWDVQVGSDGETACATCHFHAGTDRRTRNTLHPGANGVVDALVRSNGEVVAADFPFVRFADPEERDSGRSVRDDRVGAQGVVRSRFLGSNAARAEETGRVLRASAFTQNGRNLRQPTARNAPSPINAVFNFANFWDGRANHFFNGVNPFGVMDPEARVYLRQGGSLVPISLTADLTENPYALDNASLASQAVGPVLSEVEMSFLGRTWPEVGRKLLGLRPLAKQEVHPEDSRLANLRHATGLGLAVTYEEMIRRAFLPEFWDSPQRIDGFRQIELNFSLFFGLALQLYQATLVADDTPFDRFLLGDLTAMSESAQRGMNLFFSGGLGCAVCHVGPELTGASVSHARAPGEAGLIELMAMGDGGLANYDIGFYNVSVTRATDDPGRGGRITLNGQSMPLSFTGQYFERATLPFAPLARPGCVNDFLAEPPTICPPGDDAVSRQAVVGAFKTPGLRNVELTGPYFHDGGMLTLMQVVDFYTRGGNFHQENLAFLDPRIDRIGQLRGNEERKRELVDFLLALTDERVRFERAPFDHPQLRVPDGHRGRFSGNPKRSRHLLDEAIEIPAVGRFGRSPAQGSLRPYLAPDSMTSAQFHYQH